MRRLSIIYVVLAAVISFLLVEFQIYPADIIIDWFVESDGRFMIILPVCVIFIGLLVPLFIVFFLYNLKGTNKQGEHIVLLDEAGVIIRRDKALYGAVFPIDIIIDGKKKATVTIGKTIQVALPLGEHEIEVRAMGKGTSTKVNLLDNKPKTFKVGFRMAGTMQDIYLDEVADHF